MRLLLHICCGPCATYVYSHLSDEGHQVDGYFYNPNIHPLAEFERRLAAARAVAGNAGFDLLAEPPSYEHWIDAVGGSTASRCRKCYELRLLRTAEEAKMRGLDGFSSTLLISPYQQHEILRAAGEAAARQTGLVFYYQDFRAFFRQTFALSRSLDLYRQNYCGCISSDYERSMARDAQKRK